MVASAPPSFRQELRGTDGTLVTAHQ